jgi:predicted RecA/RadA family phage recombinase
MKNFIETGEVLNVPAPSGGVLSGGVVIIGSLIGIAETTQAVGVTVAVVTKGVFELPKVSAQAWAVGNPIYWDSGAGNATTTSTSNTLLGYATEVAANPSSVGRVRLNG